MSSIYVLPKIGIARYSQGLKMSLDSWKDKYYPINATECNQQNAILHMLQQWKGFEPENLARHEVTVENGTLTDTTESLDIDGDSSALCNWFYDTATGTCVTCPLYKLVGVACFESLPPQAYATWFINQNPTPMINALEQCLEQTKYYTERDPMTRLEKALLVTQAQIKSFEEAIIKNNQGSCPPGVDPIIQKTMLDGLKSQLETLKLEESRLLEKHT